MVQSNGKTLPMVLCIMITLIVELKLQMAASQETSGQKLIDFARDHFFSKMGVESFNWKTYGEYCAGATGLSLFNKDLHKFGQLLLNNGLWKNKQIISKKWIKYISTSFYCNLDNRYREDPLGINSYGLFMWICINGDYFIKGKGGHY